MINLLYIDDNEEDRFAAERVFLGSDYIMKTLSTAKAGFEELEKKNYEVVVCDMMMRGNDGLYFANELARRGIKTAIILTSGVSSLKKFEHYTGLPGYKGFIEKPLTIEKLEKIL